MMKCDQFYKVVAIGLIYVTATASSVVPSSDPSPLKSILGSVSAIGDVQIRGISIKQEATVFSGDQLRVGEKGYAIVLFKNGQKIELAEKTDISVTTFTNGLQIVLGSGRLGFATSNGAPITVTTGSLETVASQPAAGHVAVMGTNSIGVRVVNGNVLLRNTKTKQSWVVTAGQERLLSLGVSKPAEPITEIASNIPRPLPTVPPPQQQPGGSASNSSVLSRWWNMATLAVAGTFGSLVVFTDPSGASPSRAATAQQAVETAVTTAQNAAAAASQVVGIGQQVVTAIESAQNVPAATRTNLMSRARTLVAQAQASDQRIVSLLAQLQQFQNQVSGQTRQPAQYRGASVNREVTPDTAPSQAQIDSLISSLNAEIAFLNQLILELNSLTLTAANEGIANVPNINMQTIGPAHGGARIASGTLP